MSKNNNNNQPRDTSSDTCLQISHLLTAVSRLMPNGHLIMNALQDMHDQEMNNLFVEVDNETHEVKTGSFQSSMMLWVVTGGMLVRWSEYKQRLILTMLSLSRSWLPSGK